ncbi:thiamine pyrophosphokinase [Rhizopus delemar RA 99-880]|uniref:Thiamine pyrophosphokinase n=1 Tax=Rhizopus delemar (strain RA 99-880 / ATCC MYA-4621 / FGSC 9543 / NRRL 43880) TaxID=246409 RepID=I1C1D5_RHIO9|nr:thiamine pyrophosphokinase [Rhizopus delemar RA 99-880]|eukprot:EIE82265.1 thiamine pyrophosphokinase [Rhizopus delemar RA 99-880]
MDIFHKLWDNACIKLVADGGSNRLYDAFRHDKALLEKGDLDSIRPEVWEYYESKNVKITKIDDQDSNDFMKCVNLLSEKEKENNETVREKSLVLYKSTPALGGRFDQTMSSIHVLYTLKDQVKKKVILVSSENLTMLLDKGKHHIHCQLDLEGPTCGVIPVSAPAVISSHGLKWDMNNLHCHFGGVISTSNVLDNELIEITTDSPVVWTVEIKSFVQ